MKVSGGYCLQIHAGRSLNVLLINRITARSSQKINLHAGHQEYPPNVVLIMKINARLARYTQLPMKIHIY